MAEAQNKYPVRITRKGMVVWGGLIFFVMGWMFVLGILVGRGTAPVPFKGRALEKELSDLKAAMRSDGNAGVYAGTRSDDVQTTDLGFYEALKMPPARENYKISPPHPPAHHPEAVVSQKETTASPASAAPPKEVPSDSGATVAPSSAQRSVVSRPEPRAPAPAPPPAQTGRFTVQVAAFKDNQSADRLAAVLRAKGYPVFTHRTKIQGKGAWYRVRVGAYDSRAAAEAMLKRLQSDQFKGIVVGSS